MNDRRKRRGMKWIVFVVALVAIAGAAFFAGQGAVRSFFYPRPTAMPPVVNQPMDELLHRLEQALSEHAPEVAASLRPGLTDEKISEIETASGFRLTEDLRALYRWHDGLSESGPRDFIPGHRFLPLEEAVRQRAAVGEQLAAASPVQRASYALFAGHRHGWLTVLDDGAGDGYCYDPSRTDAGGAFFYHFAEDGEYVFFPSLRNFIAGVIECFETEAYRPSPREGHLNESFELTVEIWSRYGSRPR